MENLLEVSNLLTVSTSVSTFSTNSATTFYQNNEPNFAFILKTISSMLTRFENVKEEYYIAGINNLRKKINFLQLNYDFQNGEISEDDYENEIESRPDKYVVNVQMLNKHSDLLILNDIISKIGDDLSVDEIAEIFSVDLNIFDKMIK